FNRLWCLLLVAAVSAEDWMLHTPGGGPLESRCPCITPELCPRIFGESELDVRHFGQIPICLDSRQVRCCGASLSVSVPDVPGHVTGSGEGNTSLGQQEASKNITQQMSLEQHTNSSQTTLNSMSHQTFITVQQQKSIAGLEDSKKISSVTVDLKNDLNISPEENTNRPNFQQSDPIIVFPWNMAGTSDPTELETVYLIHPKDGDENDTDAWSWNMNDDALLSSNMTELRLLELDYKNSKNLTETPKVSSIIEQILAETTDMPEKEYPVASHSKSNRIQAHNEMQENHEDQVDDGEAEDDGEEHDVDEDNDKNQVETPTSGLTLTNHMQSKQANVPKRSFVSENLKMRISKLATREGRPGPRGKPAADETRSVNSRYHTGQRSRQSLHSMRVIEKQSASHRETATNRLPGPSSLLNTSVDRITARPQAFRRSSSNVKNSARMAVPHASRPQYIFSHQLDRNLTEGTVTDINDLQRGGHLHEMYLRENSERTANTNLIKTGDNPVDGNNGNHTNNTKSTDAEAIQTYRTDQNGVAENIRPVVRRKTAETLHGNFGARTRTRDRPPSIQMSPSYVHTKNEGGTGSVTMKFVHNQQTGQSVAEPPLSKQEELPATRVTPLGSDVRQFVNGDTSVEEAGLISAVGKPPKGFTDSAVSLQNMGSVNQRDPLFHLPYSIHPRPFLNQISDSKVPQILVPVTPPPSGAPTFNPHVSVFHQPQSQSFQQHDVLTHAATHSPQKYIYTIIATPNSANMVNFNRQEWHAAQQNWLPSNQQADLYVPQVQSPLIAQKFNLPSTRNLTPLYLPTQNDPQKTTTDIPVAVIHSFPNDETIRAQIMPISQSSPLNKFLSFSDQQLKLLAEQSTHGSQPLTKPPAEGGPAPQLDARRHTTEQHTKKLH
ncbi:hypothetical protein B7P43_G16312, partial [Cryptotermes secundus]